MNGAAAYRASKVALEPSQNLPMNGGVMVFVRMLSRRLGQNADDGRDITRCCGWPFKSQNPMRRLGTIEDITPLLLFDERSRTPH